MVRFATVAAVLALMAAPLVAQESTEQLRKELESLRKEVDGMKADRAQYESKEIPGNAKVAPGSMAPDGDSPVMTLLKGTKLSGHVDAGYVVSFNGMHNTPGNTGVNAGAVRAFDERDNSFYLNAVQLNIENLASKDRVVGYHIELAAGHDVSIYENPTGVGLQEGWVQFWMPMAEGLDIRVGKMATLVGYEVIESHLDNNYSRSILFTKLQNFTQTGVRAALSIGEKITTTVGFSNGPNFGDHFADGDHGKMVELQLGLKVTPDLFVNTTLLFGNDTEVISTNSGDKFYVFDITAGWTLDKLVLGLNIDFVSAQLGGGTSAPAAGIALYAKYNMTDSFAPSIRVEYVNDEDGALAPPIGVAGEGGPGAKVVEFTLTGEFKIATMAIFRVELRHDASNDHIFNRDGNPAKGNTTLGFETILPF